MQPLILAIEPDTRQAAMVKRIVREKVLADVAVVDSRDAALEAMRTTIPDVLLLSALLSPRDEDELVAHLRTLQHAEHLQTHTIPQLASSMSDADQPSKGLLSAFRRKKSPGRAPAGCDPDLFAEEIRTYLHAASEKKREVRDASVVSPLLSKPSAAAAAVAPVRTDSVETKVETGSSWDSPFEWRPSSVTRTATVVEPEPVKADPEPIVRDPEPFVPEAIAARESIAEPEPLFAYDAVAAPEPEILRETAIVREPEILAEPVAAFAEPAAFEPALAEPRIAEPAIAEPVFVAAAVAAEPEPVVIKVRLPLVMRIAREWWFEEGRETKTAATAPGTQLSEVLEARGIPMSIAAIVYADSCRIRRVRLMPA
jgi:CheY-like chemotaxis protein